jgi:hypothetical protein
MDPLTRKLVEAVNKITKSGHAPGVEHVAGWLADRLNIPAHEVTSSISGRLDGSHDLGRIEQAFHAYIEGHPAVERLVGKKYGGTGKLDQIEDDLKQDASHMLDRYYSSK